MASTELLVIIGELLNVEQKEQLGEAIVEGLRSLKLDDLNLCDELRDLANATPLAQKDADTDKEWLEFSSDKLVTRVLLRPSYAFLSRHLDNLFASTNSKTHKCIAFAGMIADGSGDWFLSDATYAPDRLVSKLRELDVQKPTPSEGEDEASVKTCLHVVCPKPDGEWKALENRLSSRFTCVQVNGEETSTERAGLVEFATYLSSLISVYQLEQRFESSPIMGMLRFSRPSMYIFPEGAGDACLLGVYGFNLLVNTGASKDPAFWNFIRHVDRIDAVMMTHWSHDNLLGLSNFVERKTLPAYNGPPVGCFLGPPGPGKGQSAKRPAKPASEETAATENGGDATAEKPSLLVNLAREVNVTMERIRGMNVSFDEIKAVGGAAPTGRSSAAAAPTSNHIILYQKIGHGCLELHPLSPAGDSKEVKDFVAQWSKQNAQFSSVKIGNQSVPLPQALSLCAMLFWKPAKLTEPVLRVLYPGALPQGRIFEQLEKLVKAHECLRHPVYVPADIAAAAAAKKKAPSGDAIRKEKAAGAPASARPSMTPRRSTAGAKDAKDGAKDAKDGVKEAPKNGAGAKSAIAKEPASKRPTSAASSKPAPSKTAPSKPAPSKAAPASTRKSEPATPRRSNVGSAASKPGAAKTGAPKAGAAKTKGPSAKTTSSPPPNEAMPPPAAPEAPPKEEAPPAPPAEEPVNQLIDLEPAPAAPAVEQPPVVNNEAVEPLLDLSGPPVDGLVTTSGDPEGLPAPGPHSSASASRDSLDSQDSVKAVAVAKTDADRDEMLASATMTDSLYLATMSAEKPPGGEVAEFDPVQAWGAPQGLPPPSGAAAGKRPATGRPSTAGGARKGAAAAEKAVSYGPVVPCYVDLAYVPNHGDTRSADAEFFKRVRAQFYVLSSVDPSPVLLDAMLDGKESWGEAGGEGGSTTLIPTYDNDTVLAWMARNKERLESARVVLAPSAHRCTIQLQDHQDAVCTAYRVEF